MCAPECNLHNRASIITLQHLCSTTWQLTMWAELLNYKRCGSHNYTYRPPQLGWVSEQVLYGQWTRLSLFRRESGHARLCIYTLYLQAEPPATEETSTQQTTQTESESDTSHGSTEDDDNVSLHI